MGRIKKSRDMSSFGLIGRTLSSDAAMLARIASADDALVARAVSAALRDPERVRALVRGILEDSVPADGEHQPAQMAGA